MGQALGHRLSPYGYEYVKKTATSPAGLIINEEQGAVVRWLFEAFASGTGLCVLTRLLEERGVRTRMGKTTWDATHLKHMLQNTIYAGTRYYNKMTTLPSIEPSKSGAHTCTATSRSGVTQTQSALRQYYKTLAPSPS